MSKFSSHPVLMTCCGQRYTSVTASADHQCVAVNEAIDGAEVVRRWLEIPADKRYTSIEEFRAAAAATPSPFRFYQSSMEAVAALDEYIDQQAWRDRERFGTPANA